MANDVQHAKYWSAWPGPMPTATNTWATWPAPTCRPTSLPAITGCVGNDVLMVSGSDAHGTPITVRADEEGVPPREIFERYHQTFLETYQQIGLTFDLFTHTDTENHHRVSQDIFLELLENGYLYKEVQQQLYSPQEGRFLPDRYVEGDVPPLRLSRRPRRPVRQLRQAAGADGADQPAQQGQRRHRPGAARDRALLPRPGQAQRRAAATISTTTRITGGPTCINFARNYVKDLHGRPITRDIDWGIPIPLPGYEGKCLYVWFEAVIGYFSASVEWAQEPGHARGLEGHGGTIPRRGPTTLSARTTSPSTPSSGRPSCWRWAGSTATTARRSLNLPYDVPANEYLNFEGSKFSKSRGAAVEVPYFLSKYDPDALRFYLTATAPETRDTEFSWEDFVERNNNELVATWGNLANRMLSFRLQALRRPGARAGRAGRRGPGAAGQGRGRLRDGGRAVQRLQVPRRPGRGAGPGPRGQRLPGPQGALVPDQGGPGRRRRRRCTSSCASWTT